MSEKDRAGNDTSGPGRAENLRNSENTFRGGCLRN